MAEAKIRITADVSQAQAAIDKLTNSLSSIESASGKASASLGNLGSTAKLAAGAFAALTAGIGISEIVSITGRFTDLNSRLRNATGSAENADKAFQAISDTAKRTYSDLEATAEVFIRNSMAMNELGYTTNEQIKVSEALNNAIAVSGARGQQAAAGLDAFAKAIAQGKLQGDQFDTIISNTPRVLKALADGLGVSTGELRKMVTEGKLTSDVMLPALISQMDKLRAEADGMAATLPDAFIRLKNALFESIGVFDANLKISETLAGALLVVADNVELLVGALGALAIAASALLIPLLPAVAAMAVLGAKVVAIAALGAGIAYLAKQMGLFSKKTEEAASADEVARQAAEDHTAALKRKEEAYKKLIEEQLKGIEPLLQTLQAQTENNNLSQVELAIKKNIAEAAKTLKIAESEITNEVRARIIEKTREAVLAQQTASIDKVLVALETERLGLAIGNKNEREISLAIRAKELEFGRALTDIEKERLQVAIALTQQARARERLLQGQPAQLKATQTEDLGAVDSMVADGTVSEQQAADMKLAINQQYQSNLLALEQRTAEQRLRANGVVNQEIINAVTQQMANVKMMQQGGIAGAQGVLSSMMGVFGSMAGQNKKAFETHKKLAVAQALISTYQAAAMSIAAPPGPPFSFIYVAAAIAAGMAQIAAISSQQYSGRALGGPVMANTPYLVGENGPELFMPNNAGSIQRNDQLGGGATNVNFTIVANDAVGFDNLLNTRKGMIKQMISDAMLDKGQRF